MSFCEEYNERFDCELIASGAGRWGRANRESARIRTVCPSRTSRARSPACPSSQGCICSRTSDGETIYIGKARSLRDRVRSYLGARGLHPKTDALLDEAAGLEVIVTDSVVEALALENNLVKERSPRYNVRLRDDKNYPVPAADDERSLSARARRAQRRARRQRSTPARSCRRRSRAGRWG